MREVAELKVQLKLVEESRDNIRRELIEANRNIREGLYILSVMDYDEAFYQSRKNQFYFILTGHI